MNTTMGERLDNVVRGFRVAYWQRRHAVRAVFASEYRGKNVEGNDDVQRCEEWLKGYLGEPHEHLGRSGEICPFIKTSLRRNRVTHRTYPDLTEASAKQIADVLLVEGIRLRDALDPEDGDSDLTAVCILFPKLGAPFFPNMHDAHTRSKSILMRQGIMASVFYPGYPRPALNNPDFQLYQSPYPIGAVRPMAIRDLVFVDFNEEAFTEYRRRYGAKFRAGTVPNKFGWVDKFNAAELRFPPSSQPPSQE
jgi:hypothetical protein